RIGIRATGLQIETDRVLLAHDLWVITAVVDRLELGFDVNLPQLIDQDDRRVPVEADVGRRNLELQRVIPALAKLFHDLSGLRSIFRDVRVITRQAFPLLRRHAPQPAGRRLQYAADLALPLADDVDERLAVEAQ